MPRSNLIILNGYEILFLKRNNFLHVKNVINLIRTFFIIALFSLLSFGVKAGTYYSNNTDPTKTNNWWTNTNGTGSHPSNFTTSGDIFILQNLQVCATNGNLTIGTGVTLQIDGTLWINAKNDNVNINGTVIFTNTSTTQVIMTGGTGTNSFILNSGATLKTNNVNGIQGTNCSLPTSVAHKNVTLNSYANYEFYGILSQSSAGLPSNVNNLTINNTAGVSVGSVNINGTLTVNPGVNFAPSGTITMASASSAINNSGTLTFNNLTIAATPTSQSVQCKL